MQAQAIPRPDPLNAPDLVGRTAHPPSPARPRKGIDGQRRRGEERSRQNGRAEFSLHLRFLLSGGRLPHRQGSKEDANVRMEENMLKSGWNYNQNLK
ncbi:MAG: hypothetical protein A2Z40_05425 [Deltaproteobacteria bacterium RBG_19FT_COMBO_60_16]|jgi:hypothetical protein|nr:MAG: hypothetical protein A2Z40_05425 [Deltaproteobacteria bacterium RBG_19FT_COMBO_60_16]